MPKPAIEKNALPWLDASHKITPTCIVLHWWNMPDNEPGIEALRSVLGSRELSVQFAILKNGAIYQLSPSEDTYCRHAKCANDSSIGIEIEGNSAEDLDNNDVQYQSVLALTRYLKIKYSIEDSFKVTDDNHEIRFFGVSSHKQVDAYCADSSGKDDVHDEYLHRVISDLR